MELYKPFKAHGSKRYKFFVFVKDDKGNPKKIGFGLKGSKDFRSGTATKADRKAYRARASKIKNKKGELTFKNKNTANYWAYNFLW